MRRLLRVIQGLLLAVALMALVGCSGGGALALNVQGGKEAFYHMVAEGTTYTKISLPPGAQPGNMPTELKANIRFEYDARMKAEAVDSESITISYELSNYKADVTVAGQKLDVPNPFAEALKVKVKFDKTTGDVLEVTGLPELAGNQGMTAEQLKGMLQSSIAQLPKSGKVKQGDRWELEIPIPVDLPDVKVDSKLTATAEYAGNETIDGVKTAKVFVTARGPIRMTTEQQGMTITVEGDMSSDGLNFVDLKTGFLESASATSRGTITATAEKAGQRMVMAMEMEMKMTLNRK